MVKAMKPNPPLPTNRFVEEHLAASARAMKRILASEESARAALIEAGIMDKSGKLAKPYR